MSFIWRKKMHALITPWNKKEWTRKEKELHVEHTQALVRNSTSLIVRGAGFFTYLFNVTCSISSWSHKLLFISYGNWIINLMYSNFKNLKCGNKIVKHSLFITKMVSWNKIPNSWETTLEILLDTLE